MKRILEARRRERDELIDRADRYIASLSSRLDVVAAAVAGSVARGDFNVWSDIDVVVIARDLPARVPDRGLLLIENAEGGVQPVGFTPDEFEVALSKRNALALEAVARGVVLVGQNFFDRYRGAR